MDIKDILKHVDHTLLGQQAKENDIRTLLDDGMKYNVASCCIPPCYVDFAVKYVDGKLPVCTVIGFPNGYNITEVKAFEAEKALSQGAKEIDMVVNITDVKNGLYDKVQKEIERLKKVCGGNILKVIIEACLLTENEKIEMCKAVTSAGADFIKTSTGFSTGGATFDDVKLLRANVGKNVKVKAAGGISSLDDAVKFIELGADRLGTSRIVKIVKEGNDGNSNAY